MDDFNYVLEGDVLFRNEISKTEQPNVFEVRKVPVINKEAFMLCYNSWIGGNENDTTAE